MIPDEEIIEIKKKLEEHEKSIKKLESVLEQEKGKSTKEIGVDIGTVIEKLSKDAGIPEERVRHVFDFEDEDLNLIATVEGKNEDEKQFKATVCILTAYHYCYGRDEIKSQDLRKKLAWLDIKSLVNLSTNLAKYKRFIIPKGKPRSPEFSYKITIPGIKKGLEIIKELSGA
jgi:hypothetical protein